MPSRSAGLDSESPHVGCYIKKHHGVTPWRGNIVSRSEIGAPLGNYAREVRRRISPKAVAPKSRNAHAEGSGTGETVKVLPPSEKSPPA